MGWWEGVVVGGDAESCGFCESKPDVYDICARCSCEMSKDCKVMYNLAVSKQNWLIPHSSCQRRSEGQEG